MATGSEVGTYATLTRVDMAWNVAYVTADQNRGDRSAAEARAHAPQRLSFARGEWGRHERPPTELPVVRRAAGGPCAESVTRSKDRSAQNGSHHEHQQDHHCGGPSARPFPQWLY